MPTAAPLPLSDADIDALQAQLDRVPAPLEPLDVSSLDGFLCGVIVQPERIPVARWLAFVTDADGRSLPAGFDAEALHGLVLRRHAELVRAIVARSWFDPWVFADHGDDEGAGTNIDVSDEADRGPAAVDAVFPWVAGIATAFELFPGVMQLPPESTLEPLALLYRHLDADDLEDADALLEEIESLEPPADLAEAVEGLVQATLLLADAAQPVRSAGKAPRPTRGRR